MNILCIVIKPDCTNEILQIPEEILVQLSKNLREKRTEMIHTKDRSIEVEGVYIAGKGSKIRFLPLKMDSEGEQE